MARAGDAAGFGTVTRGATVRLGSFDHPFRTELTNELHARPFQPVSLPGQVLSIAFKPASGAAERDALLDHAHLAEFLSRHGAALPRTDASHHTAAIGDFRLKWERHTEFVSYTLFGNVSADGPFSGDLVQRLPEDWIADAPGAVAAAIQCEILQAADGGSALEMLFGEVGRGFESGSRAGSFILDGNALAASDFRMHGEGFTRFVIIAFGDAGPRRLGRACQRLIDIEVYRALAMLALPIAQRTARRLNEVERELTALMEQVTAPEQADSEADDLRTLTNLSAEIESLAAASAFRFGAARAYASIVEERIETLREERAPGQQKFRDFFVRRFHPAIRTVLAVEGRLKALSERAARIAELMRTRVNVSLESQNRDLLESMNRRAAMQLRLQQTVEGLSVVAISYYAANLATYILAPIGERFGFGKTAVTAVITVPVIAVVWWLVKQGRERIWAPKPGREP